MKTIAYNPQREILTALLTLILSFAVLTAVKAQGNFGPQPANENKKERSEEKAIKPANNDEALNLASEKLLTLKIESWMKSGAYWDWTSDEDVMVGKLANNIKKWITEGSYWSSANNNKTDIDQPALSMKREITIDALAEDAKQ